MAILLTPGDPRGIGPEVALRALEVFREECPDVCVGLVGPDGRLGEDALPRMTAEAAGQRLTDEEAGRYAAGAIERAVALALEDRADALVTGPVHKPSLHAAGWSLPGQTELLGALTNAPRVGMLMVAERTRLGPPLRVLLATTHIPLRAVPAALTEDLIVEQIELLDQALRGDWRLDTPRIAMCALNPHASDDSLFGSEEADVFEPALTRARASGVQVDGPLPADTVFSLALGGAYDAVVAPYHDVGMAAFKTVAFGTGVNVTIGLPFIRTSPDHGTAFGIVGTGRADPSSMLEALRLARRLAHNRFDTGSADV